MTTQRRLAWIAPGDVNGFFGLVVDNLSILGFLATALIGIFQLTSLPLTFLSSAIMDTSLSPAWVRAVGKFNPFEWAVVVGRGALQPAPDWATIWAHLGFLAALTALMAWVATRAFRAYQRSA